MKLLRWGGKGEIPQLILEQALDAKIGNSSSAEPNRQEAPCVQLHPIKV